MFSLISSAMAQDAAMPPDAHLDYMNMALFGAIFVVFYVLVIRPNQKRLAEQVSMIKALKPGDKVVASGGIHGKVSKVNDDKTIMLEIANGVEIKLDKESVHSVENKDKNTEAQDKK